MAHALGVIGLHGLQLSQIKQHFGQSLHVDNFSGRFQYIQDAAGAPCFREKSLPPLVASSLTSSNEEQIAVKKEKKKGSLRKCKVAGRVELPSRDQQQSVARALTVLHEQISGVALQNISLSEDELTRYSMILPDASTLLRRSMLEAQWALTLKELMHEQKMEEQKISRRASKGKKSSTVEPVEDVSTGTNPAATEDLAVEDLTGDVKVMQRKVTRRRGKGKLKQDEREPETSLQGTEHVHTEGSEKVVNHIRSGERLKDRKTTRRGGEGKLMEIERQLGSTSEDDAYAESTSAITTELVVKSGSPSARTRRLESRQRRVAVSGKPTSPDALTIHPLKKYQRGERVRRVKFDGVQDYLTTYLREITKINLLTKQEEIFLSKKLRIGLNLLEERKKLAAELGYVPSNEEWAPHMNLSVGDLVRKLGEAEWARDKMVMANLRLVVSVAKQYHSFGLEMADLIQEGSIGLLRGVEKFDHTRGYKLSTYVHWWIRQGVTRAIADHSRTVRLPVHVHDTLGRIRKAKSALLSEGCTASVQEISEATNLTGTKIKNTLQVTKKLVSLDKEIGRNTLQSGDGETLHSLVADRDIENQPWTIVERMLMKDDVDKLLTSQLGPRERDIVRLHYGVGREDGSVMSLESISYRYGVSRERVRQLETAAMRKLQIKSREQGLDRYLHSMQ